MNKPILHIFGGANGSGKTTLAQIFTKGLDIPFLNADNIAHELPMNFEDAQIKAGRIFLNKITKALPKHQSFAIESTLSGQTIKKVINKAKKEGFRIHTYYTFLHNPNNNISRIKLRTSKGGHYISDEDVIRRFYRSKTQFWHIYRQLSDKWILIYNEFDPLTLIAEGYQNDITIHDQSIFKKHLEKTDEGTKIQLITRLC